MRRRFIDPVIADWQFERATALARGDRWGARLATVRAVAALARGDRLSPRGCAA
jgi:hypothetical protein